MQHNKVSPEPRDLIMSARTGNVTVWNMSQRRRVSCDVCVWEGRGGVWVLGALGITEPQWKLHGTRPGGMRTVFIRSCCVSVLFRRWEQLLWPSVSGPSWKLELKIQESRRKPEDKVCQLRSGKSLYLQWTTLWDLWYNKVNLVGSVQTLTG